MDDKFKLLLLELLMENAVTSNNKDKLEECIALKDELLETIESTHLETIVTSTHINNVTDAIDKHNRKK
ncbi:MAG: hypothetical protein GOVbin7581_43 [Prokaryotic dsDNA virus sp.]|nr:MAG: hypothetical protein GOVbin7581_43 [Prokaryotic dsDNA virus sp.]|tara:strand:+ start:20923 stop:21129 length:207 start_codon:yes stop_codon:yes gene_type:complete